MAINFAEQVYSPTYDVFSRPVTFLPKVGAPFAGRGIWTTQKFDIETESAAIFSDAQTILDILEKEFTTMPSQGDQVFIPAHIGMPEVGTFEILDLDTNGFETTLALRRVMTSKP